MELPDRDQLIAGLVRLRDQSEAASDERVRFLGQEFRVALYAVVQAADAVAREDHLGGLQYLRLLNESTLRVRWIGGDEDRGDSTGRPFVEAAVVSVRVESLRKRDLLHLAAAYKAIHEVWGDPIPLPPELTGLADRITVAPAPRNISGMAKSATAQTVYAEHRLCSSMIHPGAGIALVHLMSAETLGKMVDGSAYLCAAWGYAILRSLEPAISGQ